MQLTVVGRGTAGCITALYAQRKYPTYTVTMVYDDKIPIIGVGESTTPPFMKMMHEIGISLDDLVKNCDATVKSSIKFVNWNGDGKYYHHGFEYDYDPLTAAHEMYNGKCLDTVDYSSQLSDAGKFDKDSNYAVHFNAKVLAEYLEMVAVERGIIIENGNIKTVHKNSEGFVEELVLDSGKKIKTDFVFDCSGFARLFADKEYKSPYKSYEKHLPTKRAMPFFLKREEDKIPVYTEAIAMKYGWMWKIPVGDRYGCGYVFDSDYITDEQAYDEICEITGQQPFVPKKISFKPGYFTKPFNKNTVSLGLSHGFLEPLEATSIWLVIAMLINLPDLENDLCYTNYIDRYNRITETIVDKFVALIYLHYMTDRKDTDFWKDFMDKNEMPEHVKYITGILNERLLSCEDLNCDDTDLFEVDSWMKCCAGVSRVPMDTIKKIYDPDSSFVVKSVEHDLRRKLKKCMDHTQFINTTKTNNRSPLHM
jgi:tryptophan halogenase